MRVAAFQRSPIIHDEVAAGDWLARDLLWADAHGVELAMFPECCFGGHSYEEATIGERAMSRVSPKWRTLLSLLKPFSTAAIIGAFERQETSITNSAMLIEGGRIIGRYAKAHPNEPGVAAGVDFPVFTRAGVRFGINICNDANYPDAAQRLAVQGADLICYPLNNLLSRSKATLWRTRSVENLIARAMQTRCWVMSADVAGEVDGKVSYGCTTIISPQGQIVARAAELAEGVAVFDLPSRSA